MDASVIIAVLGGLVVLWLVLLGLLWLLRPRGVPVREVLRVVPDLLRLVRSLVTDRGVPLDVRVVLLVALVWVISPIDPVPEIIPLLGQLDDVIVTIVALRYVRRRLGSAELRRRWTGSDEGFTTLRAIMG